MYELTKVKSFYSSLVALRYCYVIPKVVDERNLIGFLSTFTIVRLLSFAAFFLMPGMHLLVTVRAKNGVDISEDLSTLFGCIGALTTITSFYVLRKKWMKFFHDLENCGKLTSHVDFENQRKKLNMYSILYTMYTLVGVVIYALIAATETSYCKRFNKENDLHEICGSFTPLVLPFDANNIYILLPIFLLQMVLAVFCLTPTAIISFLSYEAVETIKPHITVLKQCLGDVFDTSNDKKRKDRLRFCISYHETLLSLCHRLSILVKYTSGNLGIICAVLFGCIGNLILKSKPFAGVCYLMGYVAALFLLCHAGQTITNETLAIGDAIYDSRWYEADTKIMKDIMFMLARSQIPANLNTLPLGVLDYSLFVMIMKTSYSYLTLLTQNT